MAHSPNMAYFFHINFISFFQVFSFPFYFVVLPLHNILKLGKTSLHVLVGTRFISIIHFSHTKFNQLLNFSPTHDSLTYLLFSPNKLMRNREAAIMKAAQRAGSL